MYRPTKNVFTLWSSFSIIAIIITITLAIQSVEVHGWTDCVFHKEILLPELETTISKPSFTNGTSFSNPYSIEKAAAPIPVTYTNNPKIVHRWLSQNLPSPSQTKNAILGFDVESVPNTPWFKNKVLFEGPATVQLATPSNCLVIHLTRKYNQNQSPPLSILKAVLQDESIIKVGAAIDEDMMELYRFNPNLQGKSRFDLGGIASNNPKCRIGLKALVQSLLGIELKKSKKLAMSNWSKPLTHAQIHYCARDAWAGAAVLRALQKIHPNTFHSNSIYNYVSQERSVPELIQRAKSRKRARLEMKKIIEQYREYANIHPRTSFHDLNLPPPIQEEVDALQVIMKDTAPDGLRVFDEEFLGFSLTPR